MPNTIYAAKIINDWVMGKANPPAVGNRYLALFSTACTDGGGGTELSGNGYNRVRVDDDFNADSGSDKTNTNINAIEFPAASADWTVHSIALFDASSGGNMIRYNAITGGPITLPSGQILRINSSSLEVVS